MKSQQPLVSIIIVNWNGGEVFKQCLKSLYKIDYPNWELIVVDNGSTDGSDSFIKSQVIHNNKNVGFAKANNQGYRLAKGKYILLLNNDTKVESDFLTRMVEKMEGDRSLGVIQPKILLMDKKGYLDNAGSYFTRIGFLEHWGFMQKDGLGFSKEKEIFSAKGACMLIRKEVIKRVGLFDADFVSYFEESDFCWRVWLAGFRVIFYPQVKIYHKLGFTIRRLDVLNLNYHYYKNRICSLIKNLGGENLFTVLTAHILISLGIMVVFLVRFHPRTALLIVKALGWNIVYLSATLNKRKKIQSFRKTTDKEIFTKLSSPIKWKKYFNDFRRIEVDLKRKNMVSKIAI